MKKMKKIGILTSGGDAPGTNAAVRAVTRAALAKGIEVVGIYEGYKGLIHPNIKPLNEHDVGNILNHGGTVLYTARCDEFKSAEGVQKAVKNCQENDIDSIVAIGGDGTFRGLSDLSRSGIHCIGIPGTIDNDITATDYTIGYDTAMNTVVEMVDRLRDTCESHARCNVVEVMGRAAGHIALETGIAVGASAIVINEVPFDEALAFRRIQEAKQRGRRNFIVIVAEGVKDFSEPFAKRFEEVTGIETRFARLAHVIRGGSPSLRDRVVASRMGTAAVELLLEGETNRVVCLNDDNIVSMDIQKALLLDKMFKTPGYRPREEHYSELEIQEMEDFCAERYNRMLRLYETADILSARLQC